MEKKIGTALVKELCPVCGKKVDGPILINKTLLEKEAKRVEALHGKVIGFSEEPCTECKDIMEEAFMFIGFDEEKSDLEHLPQGFYKTGHVLGVKKEIPLVQEWVKKNSPEGYKKGFLYLPHTVMKKLGLIKTLDYGGTTDNL